MLEGERRGVDVVGLAGSVGLEFLSAAGSRGGESGRDQQGRTRSRRATRPSLLNHHHARQAYRTRVDSLVAHHALVGP